VYAVYSKLLFDDLLLDSTMPVGRKRVGYVKMAFGLFYLGLYVVFYGSYNFSVALQPSFAAKSLLTRCVHLIVSCTFRVLADLYTCSIALFQFYGIFERCKYYAIWTLTEGAAVITGLGFTGYSATGASKWDGAANINVANIELGENFKMILDNWNMKTNQWLRECIYKRITPEGQKPGFSRYIYFL
jgi:lysophospholipid acyltransferase